MKDDLISRSSLLEKRCRIVGYLDQSGYETKVVAIPVDVIERAPAVDAVEVVRCVECRRATRGGDGYVWCWSRTMPLDGFCSYGERKEGADNG